MKERVRKMWRKFLYRAGVRPRVCCYCRYAVTSTEKGIGLCRRSPPAFGPFKRDAYPLVSVTSTCGEFKQRRG